MSWLPGTTLTACGAPTLSQPGQRLDVLLRQPDVDEVAGHRDVVGRLRAHVGDEPVEHVAAGRRRGACAASWRSRAPLEVPIARREAGDRPQVHVRQVGDGERLFVDAAGTMAALAALRASLPNSPKPAEDGRTARAAHRADRRRAADGHQPAPDQGAAALLAPDARPDHGRAGRGARRARARAAGAARLPAGLALSGRRRREGRDARRGAGARAAGGGRHGAVRRPPQLFGSLRQLRRAFPAITSPCSWCATGGRRRVPPPNRGDPRAALLCGRRPARRARPPARGGASPRCWAARRGATGGEGALRELCQNDRTSVSSYA